MVVMNTKDMTTAGCIKALVEDLLRQLRLAPIEPIYTGLSSEMNFGAQIILKHIQNHPGHIYNIHCKTAQTFPTQSLNHLCHLVKKKKKV